jgi:hypothetical protein
VDEKALAFNHSIIQATAVAAIEHNQNNNVDAINERFGFEFVLPEMCGFPLEEKHHGCDLLLLSRLFSICQ